MITVLCTNKLGQLHQDKKSSYCVKKCEIFYDLLLNFTIESNCSSVGFNCKNILHFKNTLQTYLTKIRIHSILTAFADFQSIIIL